MEFNFSFHLQRELNLHALFIYTYHFIIIIILDRVSIISQSEDKYTVQDLDRGDFDEVSIETSNFLPSTTSHPTFYHKHEEVKSLLVKCDISRIPPLATPCALPVKNREETSSICEDKEGEFVSFEVIDKNMILLPGLAQINAPIFK